MKTLNEIAGKYPQIKKILSDISIGHTDAASQINYHFASYSNYTASLGTERGFTTTETSVRRWRRATMSALDGPESHVETRTEVAGSPVKGSPLNPLEAVTEPPDMRILVLDIETTPILAYVWGTWKENVNHDMIVQPSEILCFAASWIDSNDVIISARTVGTQEMLKVLWDLLNEADVVVHYNGKKFDIPKINTAFIMNGFTPPSPYKQVDLLLTARSTFKFESNKLDYVSSKLSTSGKKNAGGFALWKGCMEDDEESWQRMLLYNAQDVRATKEVYMYMRPWITAHPSFAAFRGTLVCPTCGSKKLQKDGYYYTSVSKYPRYVCACGTWSRSSHRISGAEITGVAV